MPHARLGCSSTAFRRLAVVEALAEALAGLDAAEVVASNLTVRSVNGDIGDVNDALTESQERDRHIHRLAADLIDRTR